MRKKHPFHFLAILLLSCSLHFCGILRLETIQNNNQRSQADVSEAQARTFVIIWKYHSKILLASIYCYRLTTLSFSFQYNVNILEYCCFSLSHKIKFHRDFHLSPSLLEITCNKRESTFVAMTLNYRIPFSKKWAGANIRFILFHSAF